MSTTIDSIRPSVTIRVEQTTCLIQALLIILQVTRNDIGSISRRPWPAHRPSHNPPTQTAPLRLRHHQQIKIAVRPRIAPCAAAEQPDHLRVKRSHKPRHQGVERFLLAAIGAVIRLDLSLGGLTLRGMGQRSSNPCRMGHAAAATSPTPAPIAARTRRVAPCGAKAARLPQTMA